MAGYPQEAHELALALYLGPPRRTLREVADEMHTQGWMLDTSTVLRWLRKHPEYQPRDTSIPRLVVLTETIVRMRANGLTWTAISLATGMSRSGAFARYHTWRKRNILES